MSDPCPDLRKIIHIDMDCFYAAVEERDRPELKGIPIAVGGPGASRGVLCTANYEARKFGVRSAMPNAEALRLCPKLLIVPPRWKAYKEASQIIRGIFSRYTELIEPLSLDEAYLEVTGKDHCGGSATYMAQEIKNLIKKETRLTASAGVAPNKFLAKVASDWKKPDGLFVVRPDQVYNFVEKLPVSKINGVGKVTQKKCHSLGIETCGDLRKWSREDLILHFGKFGPRLKEYSMGIDKRQVVTQWVRKSLGLENTFSTDISFDEALLKLPDLKKELSQRFLRWKKEKGEVENRIQKIFLKLRFKDFQTVTVEKSLGKEMYQNLWDTGSFNTFLSDHLENLYLMAYERGRKPIRLLGIGFRFEDNSSKEEKGNSQLSLL